jgi:hypothetical protein
MNKVVLTLTLSLCLLPLDFQLNMERARPSNSLFCITNGTSILNKQSSAAKELNASEGSTDFDFSHRLV